jgi:hypothetical protein
MVQVHIVDYPFSPEDCALELRLTLLGRPVRILTDSPRVFEILRDMYASRHFAPTAAEPALTFHCAVQCEAPWMVAMVGGRQVHVARPSAERALVFDVFEWTPTGATPDGYFTYDVAYPQPTVDTTLELYASHFARLVIQAVLGETPSMQIIHSGAVAWGGQGVMILAPTMGGKSSLTLAATLHGGQFLSDDMTPVDLSDGMMLPFPRAVRLREASCELVPEFKRLRRGVTVDVGGEARHYVHPEILGPETLGGSVPLTHVIRLRGFAEQPRLTPVPAAAMAFACVEADCFATGQEALDLAWKWAARLQEQVCADLVAGPPLVTAGKLRDFVEGHA